MSLVVNFGAVLLTYRLLDRTGAGQWTFLGALLVLGFLLGMVFGQMQAARNQRVAIGVGAFLAVALWWTPVVLVSYGIAFIATPILGVYAYVVAEGVRLAERKTTNRDVPA